MARRLSLEDAYAQLENAAQRALSDHEAVVVQPTTLSMFRRITDSDRHQLAGLHKICPIAGPKESVWQIKDFESCLMPMAVNLPHEDCYTSEYDWQLRHSGTGKHNGTLRVWIPYRDRLEKGTTTLRSIIYAFAPPHPKNANVSPFAPPPAKNDHPFPHLQLFLEPPPSQSSHPRHSVWLSFGSLDTALDENARHSQFADPVCHTKSPDCRDELCSAPPVVVPPCRLSSGPHAKQAISPERAGVYIEVWRYEWKREDKTSHIRTSPFLHSLLSAGNTYPSPANVVFQDLGRQVWQAILLGNESCKISIFVRAGNAPPVHHDGQAVPFWKDRLENVQKYQFTREDIVSRVFSVKDLEPLPSRGGNLPGYTRIKIMQPVFTGRNIAPITVPGLSAKELEGYSFGANYTIEDLGILTPSNTRHPHPPSVAPHPHTSVAAGRKPSLYRSVYVTPAKYIQYEAENGNLLRRFFPLIPDKGWSRNQRQWKFGGKERSWDGSYWEGSQSISLFISPYKDRETPSQIIGDFFRSTLGMLSLPPPGLPPWPYKDTPVLEFQSSPWFCFVPEVPQSKIEPTEFMQIMEVRKVDPARLVDNDPARLVDKFVFQALDKNLVAHLIHLAEILLGLAQPEGVVRFYVPRKLVPNGYYDGGAIRGFD